jgi:hypothetical protein
MQRNTLSTHTITQSLHYYNDLPAQISIAQQFTEERKKKIHEIEKELAAIQKIYLPKKIRQLQQLIIKPQQETNVFVTEFNTSALNSQKFQQVMEKLLQLQQLAMSNLDAKDCIERNKSVINANRSQIDSKQKTAREAAQGTPQLGLQGEIAHLQGNIVQYREANAGNEDLVERNMQHIIDLEKSFSPSENQLKIRSLTEIQRDIKLNGDAKMLAIQKCKILEGNIENLKEKIEKLNAEIENCKSELNYYTVNFPNISTLKYNNLSIDELAKYSMDYMIQKADWEKLLLTEEEKLHALNQDRLALHQNRLITAPTELIFQLGKAMKESFSQFDSEHPDTQSEIVRKCLCQIDLRINYFIQAANQETRTEAAQFIYYQLYGMLADMEFIPIDSQQSPFTNSNLAFQGRVQTLLDLISIHRTHPEFILKNQCRRIYEDLQQMGIDLFRPKTDTYFYQIEAEQFQTAFKKVTDLLIILSFNDKKMIEKSVSDLLKNMDHTISNAPIEKQQRFYKYFTIILNKTLTLIDINLKPHTVEEKMATIKSYHFLISRCKLGASKLARKVIGAMVILFGVILSGLSVMAKIFSFGIPTPFSIGGMIAGGTVTLTGMGLFKSGMQKSISKCLHQLEKSLIENAYSQRREEQKQIEEQTRLGYSRNTI